MGLILRAKKSFTVTVQCKNFFKLLKKKRKEGF